MNALNNKRYLARIAVVSALLFACLAAGAQEVNTPQHSAEKAVELTAVIVAAEETKVEASKTEEPVNEAINDIKSEGIVGLASYYAAKFHGRRTASGEKFSQKVLTAAHLTMPFGTLLKVTNLQNMKSVIVRVNDRGPYIRGRLLDLSRAAADLIGITRVGVARVELEVIKHAAIQPSN